jgi:DNA polymerase III alpha subunit
MPDMVRADTMDRHVGKRVSMLGWWVTNKVVYTRKEEPMAFISFEDKTALFETVFFPDAFQRFCSQWSPVRPYLLKGRVEEDWGSVTLNVEGMEPIRLEGGETQPVVEKRRWIGF